MGLVSVPNWWDRFARGRAGGKSDTSTDETPDTTDAGTADSGTADAGKAAKRAGANSPDAGVPLVALDRGIESELPRGIRIAAAWSWRLLLLIVVIYVLGQIMSLLHVLVIPLAVALLLTALLHRLVYWLRRIRFPASAASAVVLVGGIAVVAAVLAVVVQQFVTGLTGLTSSVVAGINQVQDWLATGPLHVTQTQIDNGIKTFTDFLQKNVSNLATYSLTTVSTVVEVLTGLFVVLFATFFFLRDGAKIWRFLTKMLPRGASEPVWKAGNQSWHTLYNYVRGTIVVAFIDSVSILIGLLVMQIPLALPLAAVIFLGAFIPVVGAFVAGAVAVLVALVAKGWVAALIVLAIIVAVQQVEGHLLQPLVLGKAVQLHPLAIILALTTGITLSGIFGALIAVPIMAVLNTAVRSLYRSSQGLDVDSLDDPPTPVPVK